MHQALDAYFSEQPPAVFRLVARAQFSPIDINLAFLQKDGWLQTVDRLRLHTQRPGNPAAPASAIAAVLGAMQPHLLLRRLDREEDRFVSIQIGLDGEIVALSNDDDHARRFVADCFLECPPSFHRLSELEVAETWQEDPQIKALFLGMLSGAFGWDPSHGVPDNVRDSLAEAHRAFDIANYRSCVVMARRTLEALLRFGFRRLLGADPVDNRGRELSLHHIIEQFRQSQAKPIPDHLLAVADSLRLIGNVPGAHAAEVEGYQFSRSDAEYAVFSITHFVELYFSKIDSEVTQYYTLEIGPDEPEEQVPGS